MLTCPDWDDSHGLRHGFLDRDGAGGWERALADAGVLLPVVTVRQVHGTRVVTASPEGPPLEADGVATGPPGLALGVVTADCVPALLLARARRVVAAVHAGWRGAAAGVLESALGHLHTAFGVEPCEVEVALGPAIGPCCYRVGREVQTAFATRTGTLTAPCWSPA